MRNACVAGCMGIYRKDSRFQKTIHLLQMVHIASSVFAKTNKQNTLWRCTVQKSVQTHIELSWGNPSLLSREPQWQAATYMVIGCLHDLQIALARAESARLKTVRHGSEREGRSLTSPQWGAEVCFEGRGIVLTGVKTSCNSQGSWHTFIIPALGKWM